MVGAAFITERLAASYELLNKTSQSLPHIMYIQLQNRVAQVAKSSLFMITFSFVLGESSPTVPHRHTLLCEHLM